MFIHAQPLPYTADQCVPCLSGRRHMDVVQYDNSPVIAAVELDLSFKGFMPRKCCCQAQTQKY